jgi:amidohydrolase
MTDFKQAIIAEVDRYREELVQIAATIHANPELGFEEYRAAALLTETLNREGFEVHLGVGGLETAFVATLKGQTPSPRDKGPTIAFLAEYDALAGLGHACGHNLIAASAIGAALGLKAALPELAGAIQVIGTPAEETGGGKALLVEAGVFDGVDAALMIHPSDRNLIGRLSLTAYPVAIEFHGKAAHASGSPDKGINALEALLLTFSGINALRQHLRDDVRIHGVITHGGVAANIVPDYARASFLVRALDTAYATQVLDKVRACAEGAALATGARLTFSPTGPRYDARWPNPKLVALFTENAAALGLDIEQATGEERMGSSDIGNVSQVVPAIHPYLAIGSDSSASLAGHSIEFREASASPAGVEAMILGAKALALTAYDLLAKPDNLAEAWRGFEAQKAQAGMA